MWFLLPLCARFELCINKPVGHNSFMLWTGAELCMYTIHRPIVLQGLSLSQRDGRKNSVLIAGHKFRQLQAFQFSLTVTLSFSRFFFPLWRLNARWEANCALGYLQRLFLRASVGVTVKSLTAHTRGGNVSWNVWMLFSRNYWKSNSKSLKISRHGWAWSRFF